MSKLTIKDLDVKFLLNKDTDFFSSTEFENHTDLFDTLKTNTPLLPNPPNIVNIETDLIAFTIDKLADYYSTLEFFPNDEFEEKKLLLIILRSAILNTTEELVDVIEMNKSTFDFNNNLEYRLERKYKEEKEIHLEVMNANAVGNIVNSTINSIAPEKTNNPILDIIAKTKYYNDSLNPNIIFQKNQDINIIRELIKNILSTGSLKEYLNSNKLFLNQKMKKQDITNLLILSLAERYENKSSSKSLEYLNPTLSDIVIENLRNSLLPYEIICDEFPIDNLNTITVNYTNDSIPNQILVLKSDNTLVTPLTVSNSAGETTLTFSSNITGNIYLLFLNESLKAIKDQYSVDRITYKHVINTNKLTFYNEEIFKGFFYEIYSNNTRIYPSSVDIMSNYITLHFPSNITMHGYFIPNVKINSYLNFFNLNESTVESFLANNDVFTGKYKIL